jgi:hypothetical protein
MKKIIYMSYDNDDVATVKNVCRYFKQVNIHYWFDRESINPGNDHKNVLELILRTRGFLMPFFSKKTCDDANNRVQEDLKYGLEIRSKCNLGYYPWILPVKIEECILPDIKIDPFSSLQDERAINQIINNDIGIEVLKYFGEEKETIDLSTRQMLIACMIDFHNPLSAIYGINQLLMDEVYWNTTDVKKFLEKQEESIQALLKWGDSIRSTLLNFTPEKG